MKVGESQTENVAEIKARVTYRLKKAGARSIPLSRAQQLLSFPGEGAALCRLPQTRQFFWRKMLDDGGTRIDRADCRYQFLNVRGMFAGMREAACQTVGPNPVFDDWSLADICELV